MIQQPWYSGHLWTHRSQLNNTKRGTHRRSGRSESYWGETSLGGAFAALIQSQAKHKKWKAEKVATARLSSAVGCAWHGSLLMPRRRCRNSSRGRKKCLHSNKDVRVCKQRAKRAEANSTGSPPFTWMADVIYGLEWHWRTSTIGSVAIINTETASVSSSRCNFDCYKLEQ